MTGSSKSAAPGFNIPEKPPILITSLRYQLDIWVEPQTRKQVLSYRILGISEFLPTGSRQLPAWERIQLDLNQGGLDYNLA